MDTGKILNQLDNAAAQASDKFNPQKRWNNVALHPFKALCRKYLLTTGVRRLLKGKLFYGALFYTDTHDMDIRYYGIWDTHAPETRLTKYLIRTLTDKDVFFDVGANTGVLSVVACDIAGAQVHAFEASEYTYSILKRNKRPSMTLHKCAVYSHSGEVTFYDNETGASNTIEAYAEMYGGGFKTVTVPSITLDDYGVIPTVIKIDVEGAELAVLQGATTILAQSPIVILEIINEKNIRKGFDILGPARLLLSLGYVAFDIDAAGKLALKGEVRVPLTYHENVVFIKK